MTQSPGNFWTARPSSEIDPRGRVPELDALRGVASLCVVLFHFTFRYDRLFTADDAERTGAAWEWLRMFGVPMFFIISGLVIPRAFDRTLEAARDRGERLRAVRGFLVGRFSRLYPAFWAAAALTFLAVGVFGLSGRGVAMPVALANLTMIPQAVGAAASALAGERVRFPYIDGVYWSLEVEWKFYALIALLAVVGWRRWLHWALAAMVVIDMMRPGGALREAVVWTGGEQAARALSHITFVRGAQAYFLTGLLIHEQARAIRASRIRWWIAPLLALCFVRIASERDTLATAAYALNTAAVWMVVNVRVRGLANPVLLFFGTISYAMFLLHQNIGYMVIGRLVGAGWSRAGAIIAALAVAVVLATLLTFGVERPCRRLIRGRLTPPRGLSVQTAAT